MDSLLTRFTIPDDPTIMLSGAYDPWLVLLSVVIAAFSATIALQIAGQAASTSSRGVRAIALLSGSVALGCGIWAMHFIGMLAFSLCAPVRYDPLMTGLSLAPSIAASALALNLIGRPRITARQLIGGGIAVGVGIGAMHYAGMDAMRLGLTLRYEPCMFVLSILMAAALAILALWIRFGLHSLSESLGRTGTMILGGSVMGLAISGTHYTGMAAARFLGPPMVPVNAEPGDTTSLALTIALITVAVTFIVFAANTLLRYRSLVADLRANIAQRKAVEKALRESEEQFRTLIGNLPGVAFRASIPDGFRTVYMSAATESVTGYPPEDFLGDSPDRRRIFDLILAEDMPAIHEKLQIAVRDGAATAHEFRLRHRDGATRWVWAFGRPVREEEGAPRWFDGVIFDVSGRHRIEDALRDAKDRAEQAATSRSAFIAKMSHEIRTPITSILGFTEVLLGSLLSTEQRRHLRTVQTAARSLLLLLNDVLDTAKLERGSMELERRDFNLRELADELIATISATAAVKGIEIGLTYAGTLREIFVGDALRIRQVLTNILGNAIKFTEHGSVRLAIQPEGEEVHFTVCDTGIGIPSDRLEYIFDPFAQADASMSRRFGGSGLGTTISRQLVELMGGSIWAESEVGKGSTFHIRLPLAPSRGRAHPVGESQREPSLPKLHILVVDDAPLNAELITMLLQRNGHSVHSVPGGADAISAVETERYDLVLMDLMMPGIDGLEAARRIRVAEAVSGTHRTPIVALSASVLEADRMAAMAAGMDGFAAKPIELPALRLAIAAALGLVAASAA